VEPCLGPPHQLCIRHPERLGWRASRCTCAHAATLPHSAACWTQITVPGSCLVRARLLRALRLPLGRSWRRGGAQKASYPPPDTKPRFWVPCWRQSWVVRILISPLALPADACCVRSVPAPASGSERFGHGLFRHAQQPNTSRRHSCRVRRHGSGVHHVNFDWQRHELPTYDRTTWILLSWFACLSIRFALAKTVSSSN